MLPVVQQQTDWSSAEAVARAVLDRRGGVARIDAFLDAGLTRQQVAALFRRDVLGRPRIGWYVDPAVPWQGKHAVRVGGVLDCVSAAASYGLPVPPETWRILHVRLARNTPRMRHNRDRRLPMPAGTDHEVELHWTDRVDPACGWRTSLVDALLQLADCVPGDWFVAALDAALHVPDEGEPILSAEQYARFVELLPARVRPLLDLVDPRAESCIETLLRLAVGRADLGPFDLQFWPSRRYRVDIVIRMKLLLEADGEAFHDPVADAIRDAFHRGLGYLVLRFTYDEIVFHIDEVIARIREVLFTE